VQDVYQTPLRIAVHPADAVAGDECVALALDQSVQTAGELIT